MSPIIDLQLRLRQLGTLRMGELVSKNGKTYPSTRSTWRVTTSDEKIATQVAEQYGGTPLEWDSRSAEKLVIDTDVAELPIAVVPGHAISQWFELWSGGGCQRRCDGVEEVISGGGCLCDPEQRECKPTTRLSVVVRGIDALGLFRLNTGGYYAAIELGGAVAFLEQRAARGETLEGWLRIEERRVLREGQTKVFKVPVLDVAYGLDRMLPPVPRPELPNGYKPLAALPAGVSVEEGLRVAETQTATRTARSAAPIQQLDDDVPFDDVPVPVSDDSSPPVENGSDASSVTAQQKKKLNVLVGKLRDGEAITTEQLYSAVAKARSVDQATMVHLLDGARDLAGDLHWGPLRDSLSKAEASDLIERLGKLETSVAAA